MNNIIKELQELLIFMDEEGFDPDRLKTFVLKKTKKAYKDGFNARLEDPLYNKWGLLIEDEIEKGFKDIYKMLCKGYNQEVDKYSPEELIGEIRHLNSKRNSNSSQGRTENQQINLVISKNK